MRRGELTVQNRRSFLATVVAGAFSVRVARGGIASDKADSASLVSLSGTARQVGERLGALNAADLRAHVAEMLAGWRKRGLTETEMIDRSQPYRRFAEKFAPHWLEESAACAAAAEVPVDHFVGYLAGKYRDLFFAEDCTSFAAAGEATADGATIFHKNRDNVSRPQVAYHKHIVDAEGVGGFFAVGDTSDLGVMMMVNERGLAGSADVGGLSETRPKGRGVMNPDILRLVAERAERCEEALAIVQQMITDGWYAGGSKVGTHWLFADRFGTILRIAQNSVEEKHWFHRDGLVFLARGETPAANQMRAASGKLSIRDFHEAAKSPDICFGSSISGLTVRIDPRKALAGGTVWAALPAWSPSLPLYAAARAVARPLADGACFKAGARLLALRDSTSSTDFGKRLVFGDDFLARRREVQSQLHEDAAGIEQRLRAMDAAGQQEQAADLAAQASVAAWQRYQRWNAEMVPQ
jgi:hypothetical protein